MDFKLLHKHKLLKIDDLDQHLTISFEYDSIIHRVLVLYDNRVDWFYGS